MAQFNIKQFPSPLGDYLIQPNQWLLIIQFYIRMGFRPHQGII